MGTQSVGTRVVNAKMYGFFAKNKGMWSVGRYAFYEAEK